TPILPTVDWSSDYTWQLYSDASGKAFGLVFGDRWAQGVFPPEWADFSIAIKELVPIYIAFKLWGSFFKNSKILFHVDNIAIVCVLQSQTARDPVIMNMLRHMVVISMLNNFSFSGVHIKGKHNVITDFISRLQFQKAKALAPWLQEEATKIPLDFLPWRVQLSDL
ncbi:MAG: hypothetical protein GY705_28855, partial [Bacteroidetes bacterium]|nr:hypothetical protein [Bacteroidota bacterium]